MTIDEAIECERNHRLYPEYHEQLAELLEELKELRATSCGYSKEDIELNRTAMYNKAIDDIKEKLMKNGFIYTQHALDVFNEIAEQLKAGGENETK